MDGQQLPGGSGLQDGGGGLSVTGEAQGAIEKEDEGGSRCASFPGGGLPLADSTVKRWGLKPSGSLSGLLPPC